MNAQTALFVLLFLLNCLAMFIFYVFLRSRFSQKRILSELRSEVDKLIVDLGREADRDVAILESRIKNLRSLIDEADRRILVAGKETSRRKEESDILENMSRPAEDRSSVSNRPAVPAATAAPAPASSAPPSSRSARVREPEQANLLQEAFAQEPAHPAAASQPTTASEPVQIYTRPVIKRSDRQVEPFVPVQERVIDMARKGFSSELIAGTLAMPLGEVELILDMNSSSL
jgi:hypothetical protein